MTIAGRKGIYEDWLTQDGLTVIEGWAREGLTNKQIAHNMGISERSLADWINRFPAICAALKKGKAPVDFEVENALLKRAKGYTVTETVEEIYTTGERDLDGNYKVRSRHIRKITRDVPPDVTAIIYWLNNRKSECWRNRKAAEPEQQNMVFEKAAEILGGIKSAID